LWNGTDQEDAMADLGAIVRDIAEEMRALPDKGKVADYIPALAGIAPDRFGIAVVMADGTCHKAETPTSPFRSRAFPRSLP
jgi:glutaminase